MTPSVVPVWSWLWKEVRPHASRQSVSLVCTILSSTPALASPLLMKWLIDDVLPNQRWGALAVATILFLVADVARPALLLLGSLINALAVNRMMFAIRSRLTAHVQSFSAETQGRYAVGELAQRLEQDVALVGELGADILPAFIRAVVGIVLTVGLMLYLDWRLSAIILPLLPIAAFVRHRFRMMLRRRAEQVREASGRQSSLLYEMLAGAQQVQLLGAERRLARRYARLGLQTMRRQMAQRAGEGTFTLVSISIVALGGALIIGYGGSRVMLGSLTAGGLVAIYGYLGSLFVPMNTAAELSSRVSRVRASIQRLIEIEQAPAGLQDAPDAVPLAAPPRELTFRSVGFAYRDAAPVLRGVELSVRAGERVAVVGQSGCGKTSLLKLVPRLYDPAEGGIQLDGRDIRSLPLHSLRHAIGFVPQHPILFQGTIRENLRYACPTATPGEIAHALWVACFTDVVARLPGGLDAALGPMGEGLSGGEKQRLAIARALLQSRPILILDEAASALDGATERRLLSRLAESSAGRIVVFVSHRLSVASWADRAVVLRGGELVEDGPPDLLDRPGTYYRELWNDRRETGGTGETAPLASREEAQSRSAART